MRPPMRLTREAHSSMFDYISKFVTGLLEAVGNTFETLVLALFKEYKTFPCFYRVIETRVGVWENERKNRASIRFCTAIIALTARASSVFMSSNKYDHFIAHFLIGCLSCLVYTSLIRAF